MNLVKLRSFDNYILANIQLTMLQSEGINCYLVDDYSNAFGPLLTPATGGMKLMVDSNQVEQAKKLLDEADKNNLRAI